jgi:hypothetical protein
MSFLTDALVISKKDILLELRGKEALTLMLFLSLLLRVWAELQWQRGMKKRISV